MCLSRFERDASHQGWGEGTKGTLRHDLGYDRDASGVVPKTKRAAPSFAVHKKFSISPLGKGRRRPETDAVAFSRMIERSPFLWVHVSTSEWLGEERTLGGDEKEDGLARRTGNQQWNGLFILQRDGFEEGEEMREGRAKSSLLLFFLVGADGSRRSIAITLRFMMGFLVDALA
ncbi:hypothetical protein OPV22_031396 [Ensete ventricosum]|uniref:Uncharacterized protein n=1 Tax=Ensete ventricosum TaxID=4639 RepID=A0AAV8P0H5_ENSVE|nr:hypothetical protein OPV22_031396 [Ensete ventricosum]